jgi:hypothetical protein
VRITGSNESLDLIKGRADGSLLFKRHFNTNQVLELNGDARPEVREFKGDPFLALGVHKGDPIALVLVEDPKKDMLLVGLKNLRTEQIVATQQAYGSEVPQSELVFRHDGVAFVGIGSMFADLGVWNGSSFQEVGLPSELFGAVRSQFRMALSPDQTLLYVSTTRSEKIGGIRLSEKGEVTSIQTFGALVQDSTGNHETAGMCVDTNGWLYVATSVGIQVLDQAGRVNFIIPTPRPASDVCFGGKDMGELFIACGDTVYKRSTKAKGVVSGQMAPIKPAPPKL